MVNYLGVEPNDSLREFEATRGAHATFRFLEKVYTYELVRAEQATGDEK